MSGPGPATGLSEVERTLMDLERGFWAASLAGDADYYREHMAADGLLVLKEPIGVLDKTQCVGALEGSPASDVGWRLGTPRFVHVADSVIALTYRAELDAAGEEGPSVERRASVYVNRAGVWQMALHQVTDEAPDGYASLERLL